MIETASKKESTTTPQGSVIEEESNSFKLIRYFFDVVNDDTVSYNTQITDNWIESNSTIQDHIAISPVTVTMRGICGELVYEDKQAVLDYETELALAEKNNAKETIIWKYGNIRGIEDVDGKLVSIGQLAPPLSNITEMAQDNWELLKTQESKARKISNLLFGKKQNNLTSQMNNYNGLSSNAKVIRLKQIGEEFKKALLGRKSFTVTTPFGTFENMFLQSVTLHQGDEDFIGDIDITLKQVRYVDTLTTKADDKTLSELNGLAQAQSEAENNGNAQGVNRNKSYWAEAIDDQKGLFE